MANRSHLRIVGGSTASRGMGSGSASSGSGGDGGGGMDGLDLRIKALEDERKELRTELTAIRVDLGEIKGILKSAPSAIDFGELKGRVNALPTMTKLTAVVSLAVGVGTIILKWHEIAAFFVKP